MSTAQDFAQLQQIRRSHCAQKAGNHNCKGSSEITSDALKLRCELCGSCTLRFCPGCQRLEILDPDMAPIRHLRVRSCECGEWAWHPEGTSERGEWRRVAVHLHDAWLAALSGWTSGIWIMSALYEFREHYDLKLKIAKAAETIIDEAVKKGLL